MQLDAINGTSVQATSQPKAPTIAELLGCLALGTIMGVTLIKGEIVSWFRIQEMFRFQSAHMYLIMASAVATAMTGLALLRRFQARTLQGDVVTMPAPRQLGGGYQYAVGGVIFGVGWGVTGACPGPLFALFASGVPSLLIVILAALAGTWLYGALRPHLPH
jgi:uncharacterized protein